MDDKVLYNSRERVLSTINHKQTDRMPRGELCINDSVICSRIKCSSPGFDEKLSFVNQIGLDIYTISPVINAPKDTIPSRDQIIWPDIEKWADTSFFTFGIINGAFESGMEAFGLAEFFMMARSEPEELIEYVEGIEKLNMLMMDELAYRGINGVIIADDVAGMGGLMINPKDLREFFFPSLARQVEKLNKLGIAAFYHCDGNYDAIIPDLINMGFKGIQCLEAPSGMKISDLQKKYGKDLCFWGGIDTEDTIKAEDPEYSKAFTEALNQSGYNNIILGTNSGLYDGISMQGLQSIYRGE